jgi:hypothetical protein
MKKLFFLLLTAITFVSCSKSDKGEKETTVLIRVKNQTNVPFAAVSAAQSEFGAVNPGAVTSYKSLKDVVAYPGALLVVNREKVDTIYAGLLYCGTPPIPMLENGKYTLEIFADASTYSGFNSRYKKD